MSGKLAGSDRNPPPSNRQLLILLGMFIGSILVIIWLINIIANSLVWLIPPSVEQQIGKIVLPAYERLAPATPAQNTLNQLLQRLETNLPTAQKQQDYRVLYLQDETVNALALPGNAIIIYSGLLAKAESENEIMMVMGHELGHFAHRDHLRGLMQKLLWQLAIAYIIGDTTWLQSQTATVANVVSQSQFSQSQELQADEFGLTLLQATYNHVAGATDFFARLSQSRGANYAFLSTHPAPLQRVAQLERLIKQRNYPVLARSPLPPALR
ncbi:MAG TPA: peptidase M48 [Cyanobacteria bacterium UBA11372]|nr:peptidase M48 [Cyanobacteria bacterium UBA11372]